MSSNFANISLFISVTGVLLFTTVISSVILYRLASLQNSFLGIMEMEMLGLTVKF